MRTEGRFNDKFRKGVNNVFSTFGDNTVACAAGMAVLDVIERENLIEKSNRIGNYLRAELRKLAITQPLIGDVRGRGMMTGIEFVSDREAKTPATQETANLLELMKDNHVLVGSEGPDKNVLKLRPNLACIRQNAGTPRRQPPASTAPGSPYRTGSESVRPRRTPCW